MDEDDHSKQYPDSNLDCNGEKDRKDVLYLRNNSQVLCFTLYAVSLTMLSHSFKIGGIIILPFPDEDTEA